MTIIASIKKIELFPKAEIGWPEAEMASVTVILDRGTTKDIEMVFQIIGYKDFNDIAAQAQKQLADYAEELKSAAARPLSLSFSEK